MRLDQHGLKAIAKLKTNEDKAKSPLRMPLTNTIRQRLKY